MQRNGRGRGGVGRDEGWGAGASTLLRAGHEAQGKEWSGCEERLFYVRLSMFLACDLVSYYIFMSQSRNFIVTKREGVGMCFGCKLTL